MRRLSHRLKIFHVFPWNLHDFSWILHDFPCWPLATSPIGASGKARRGGCGLRSVPPLGTRRD